MPSVPQGLPGARVRAKRNITTANEELATLPIVSEHKVGVTGFATTGEIRVSVVAHEQYTCIE